MVKLHDLKEKLIKIKDNIETLEKKCQGAIDLNLL
jgi:hypothetical protein